MEIVLAESLGFCMGVKRVVDMAYRAIEKSDGEQIVTLGPLIHNAQEIKRLEKDGVETADESSIPENSTVIIRAHGVTPQALQSLKSRGLKVMDGTCPYVHYSQRKAFELYEAGYTVVIAGDRNHPEIRGILGYINDEAYVVKTAEDVRGLPALDRVGVIAQTTISPKKYQAIIEALEEKAGELKSCLSGVSRIQEREPTWSNSSSRCICCCRMASKSRAMASSILAATSIRISETKNRVPRCCAILAT